MHNSCCLRNHKKRCKTYKWVATRKPLIKLRYNGSTADLLQGFAIICGMQRAHTIETRNKTTTKLRNNSVAPGNK